MRTAAAGSSSVAPAHDWASCGWATPSMWRPTLRPAEGPIVLSASGAHVAQAESCTSDRADRGGTMVAPSRTLHATLHPPRGSSARIGDPIMAHRFGWPLAVEWTAWRRVGCRSTMPMVATFVDVAGAHHGGEESHASSRTSSSRRKQRTSMHRRVMSRRALPAATSREGRA